MSMLWSARAQAPLEEIAKFFSKLGLPQRAKFTFLLGRELCERFNKKIPSKRKDLLSLPGVGEYVADAVLCFAFNERVSIIDSNVCRVLGRVYDLKSKGEARRDPQFKRAANELLPADKVKEFNWAMIDLASFICIPRKPICYKCPLNEICQYAKSDGLKASSIEYV